MDDNRKTIELMCMSIDVTKWYSTLVRGWTHFFSLNIIYDPPYGLQSISLLIEYRN